MTKKQYLDKVYTTTHELLTLYRECFPEEELGVFSMCMFDRFSSDPEMVSFNFHVSGDKEESYHNYNIIECDGNREYKSSTEVI